MFGKRSITLSETAYRSIKRYALTVGSSVDQATEYAIAEWMASNGDRLVRAQEAKEKLMMGRMRLQVVYRNSAAR
jgi:hypothetical protein